MGGDASRARPRGGAARRAMGRGARSAVAARGHDRRRAVGPLVPALRRPPPADRGREPSLRAASRRVRSRSRDRSSALASPRSGPSSVRGRSPPSRAIRSRSTPLSPASDRHAAGVCRSLRDGVLAASGELLRRSRSRIPARRTAPLDDTLRTGADDRLPHPVSAVRRSARAGAAVASDLSRELQPRGAARHRRTGGRRRRDSGTRCARSPVSRMPAAGRAICASRRSTDGCSRRRGRRSPNVAIWTTRRRDGR